MTVEQKQCLLYYLGYYKGKVDGDWGRQSKAACSNFRQAFGLTASSTCDEETEKALKHAVAYGMPARQETKNWWDDIEYFTRDELKCKCGGKYCDGFPAEPKELLVRLADRARKHFGAPAHNVSCLRCKTHNANEGGVANSQHMYGEAMDIRINGVSADQLLAWFQQQPEVRYAYKINSTNVHFDIPNGER